MSNWDGRVGINDFVGYLKGTSVLDRKEVEKKLKSLSLNNTVFMYPKSLAVPDSREYLMSGGNAYPFEFKIVVEKECANFTPNYNGKIRQELFRKDGFVVSAAVYLPKPNSPTPTKA